ncbi:MAG: hypothetical protein LBQ39_02200 [Tannerellaceae bacterium]|nr:hypothetical protein [Tannerellaceae bacterium]
MKKDRTHLSVCTAFVFVVLILSACSSSEDENRIKPASGGTKSVSIKAIQDVITRAIGESPIITDDEYKLIVDRGGHLFFVESSSGHITHYVELTVNGKTSGKNVPRIAFDKINNQSDKIGDVPEASDWVYIILNLPESKVFKSPQGGWVGAKYDLITDVFITAEELYDTSGHVKNVPVAGNAPIDKTDPANPEVTISLRAIASRFEIESIALNKTAGVGGWDANYVASDFTVKGIYINNYYPTVSLAGNYTDLVDAERDTTHYNVNHEDFYWTEANYGRTLHTVDAGTTTNQRLATGAGKAWAYNLFPNDLPNIKTKLALPHIVLKITGLKVTTDSGGATNVVDPDTGFPFDGVNVWYITVAGYLASTPITYLERGVIYGIEKIEFPLSALTDRPEEKKVTIDGVRATLMDWDKDADISIPAQ